MNPLRYILLSNFLQPALPANFNNFIHVRPGHSPKPNIVETRFLQVGCTTNSVKRF